MTTQNGTTPSLPLQPLPPYAPGKPYALSTQDGEIIYIPLSKSATRLLVTGRETDDAFAVVGSGGSAGDPIGFHYHADAHDVFLCLQGSVNIWADDQCRTLRSGDFASVPPGTIHAYQFTSPQTEMLGLIVPGGWEEFFRFIGEPYSGPAWPLSDERPFHEVVLPRLKQAAEKFDMIPCPGKEHFEPQAWDGGHCVLPGDGRAYFLRSGMGPAWTVGGGVLRPLITGKESKGRFAIASLEDSNQHHASSLFGADGGGGGRRMRFRDAHHAFYVHAGRARFCIDAVEGESSVSELCAGEMLYVPKGTAFSLQVLSRMVKMYVFCNGGGMVELLQGIGRRCGEGEGIVVPERAEEWDRGRLDEVAGGLGCEIC